MKQASLQDEEMVSRLPSQTPSQTKLRVLQVVGKLDRGGIENWLVHVLTAIDRSRFEIDFLTHEREPGFHEAAIAALGSRIYRAGKLRNIYTYRRNVLAVLSQERKYDVVHSHLNAFSTPILTYAKHCRVRIRIAHCHSDLDRSLATASLPTRLFAACSLRVLPRSSTHLVACSNVAANSFFRYANGFGPKKQVLHCGINLEDFRQLRDREGVRGEFGIPKESIVLGHVGRFHKAKNHKLSVAIVKELNEMGVLAHLVFVGDGPEQSSIKSEVSRCSVDHRVIFAGNRTDVPRLFCSLFDVALLPSLYEGLPITVMESLAAGCPLLKSDTISTEADLVPALIHTLPLSAPASNWAMQVLRILDDTPTDSIRALALSAFDQSSFNVATSVRNLTLLYSQ